MADASLKTNIVMFYTIFVPLLLYCICSKAYWFLVKLEHITPREKTKHVCYHKGYCPKHQHHYHWFKARTKQKKQCKFRKPKPLFHLTLRAGCSLLALYLQFKSNDSSTAWPPASSTFVKWHIILPSTSVLLSLGAKHTELSTGSGCC